MADNPFMDLPDAPKQQTSSNPFMDLDDAEGETGRNREQFLEGTAIRELGEGIVSGGLGAVEGVAGLVAMIPDAIAGTDYGDKVTNAAEATRDALGLDPEGIVGKGAEIITQFVVPGGIAAKAAKGAVMAGRAAKGLSKTPLTKAERFTLASKELAAAGLADAAVSTDDMTTIGDWVDAGPTQTTDLIGLSNREKALARFGNRLKIGAEATGIGAVAQAGLGLAGKTIGDAKITKNITGATRDKIDQATRSIDNLIERRMLAKPNSAEELSTNQARLADAITFSRYRGSLPSQVAEKRLLMDGVIQKQVKQADRILKDLDLEIDSVLKKMPEGEGNLDKVGFMNKIESYLTESNPKVQARVLSEMPKGIRQNALRMRTHIKTLSEDVLDSNYLKEQKYTVDGLNVNDVVDKNINSYLRRRYQIFEDAKYVPTDESIKNADDFFRKNRGSVEKELTEAARKDVSGVFTDDFLAKNGLSKIVDDTGEFKIQVGNKVTADAGRLARENFLERYSIQSSVKSGAGRVASDRLDTGMFLTRKKIAPELQDLLGIVKDPRQAYLSTVADLAQFSAVDDYFGTVAKLANQNSGIGKFFKSNKDLTVDQQKGLLAKGFVQLGGKDGKPSGLGKVDPQGQILQTDSVNKFINNQDSGWGKLDGYFVPKGIYNDLTNHVMADDTMKYGRAILNSLLKAKGVSQYAKTVLSPITQVRNFTTAAMFATANGNMPVFGRGGSLKDSWKAVHANITNKGDQAIFDDLNDAYDRGVMATNAELREIQDTLSKGLDLGGKEPTNFVEATVGSTKVGRKVIDSNLGGKIAKGAKLMENVYQGSDDYWKYFSYNAEQSQIKKMLDGATPQEKVAYLTKNGTDAGSQGSVGSKMLRNDKIRRGEIDDDMIEDLIKDRAAQIVRDTVPNYNKGASDLIKFGRKLPVGNFITFPAEMFRTSFNIVKQGLDDMASPIKAVQARGRNRLIGFGTTTVVAPAAVTTAAYAATGVSKEEMESYQRSFAAPWEKGAILVPTGRSEDGKISYINYSTSNPYDVVSRFATRALNEADEAIKQGKNPGETFTGVIGNTLTEFFQPFLSEAMLSEAVTDVIFRGGKTSSGAEVYNPQDSAGTIGSKVIMHVADTMIPGIVPFNVSGGKLEPSRFLRGVMPGESLVKYKDKMGRERTFVGEMARQMTGVTPLEFDPKRGAEYGGFRMQRAQTDAKRKFNKVVDDENGDASTLYNAFKEANEAKLRVDREYYQMVEDLRTMGMKDSEIRKVFKKEGIGGIKGIMRGEFEPFKMSDKNRKDMQKAGIYEFYPRERINDLRSQMRRIPLAPDDGPNLARTRDAYAPPTEEPIGPASNPFMSLPNNPFMSLPDKQSSVPRPNLAPITQAQDNPFMSLPSLAGGDPNTQEIARRLGKT
tara:strand:- start:9687 stop:13892 length:4206 start_codon:yes stop_codon:yes gene_type:complete